VGITRSCYRLLSVGNMTYFSKLIEAVQPKLDTLVDVIKGWTNYRMGRGGRPKEF